ncbi:MAG TPA: DUF4350 domain-containing protein [Polyangiaceae bacterium]|nr:DUF4350 domain-containing protein [Polyangiaceae bacterium]
MSSRAIRAGLVVLLAWLLLSALALAQAADEQPASQLPKASSSSTPQQDAEDAAESSDETDGSHNPFASVPPDSVERSLSRVLSGSGSSFCKAKQAAVRDDPLLCSLSRLSARQRCPGLRQACATPVEQRPAATRSRFRRLATLGDFAFWLVLSGLLVALGLAVRSAFVGAQFTPAAARKRASPSSPETPPAAPQVAETDVARLWSIAQQSASSARFEDAVAALQAALIHALRISGKLHVSPAQTNGDYLRALRPEPSLQGTAREVFRSVEAVQFGGAPASAELYRKLFEHVQPIVVRVLSVLVLCAFGLAQSGCSKPFGADADGGGHGLDVLTQLLREQGTIVRRRIRALNVIEPEVTAILVVGEQPSEAWAKLLEFAAGGGTLVVSEGSDQLAKATHVRYSFAPYQGRLDLPDVVGVEPTRLELSAVARHALELGNSDDAERTFALAGKSVYVAERGYGAGSVLYFGDDEYLSDASLSIGDNAFFSVSLLRREGRVLELVGPWTGGGASSTLASLFKAGLGPLLAQLGLLAVLFGWHGGAAFGLRKDPVVVRRRAFRDHVLALGENYRRARATRFALASYGSWLIERLRERLSPQQPIGLIDLAGRIAARVERPEAELVLLLAEARDAQDDSATARPAPADLNTLEKLETLTVRAGGSK